MNLAYDPALLMAKVAEVQAALGEASSYLGTVAAAVGNPAHQLHEYHRDHAAANLDRTAGVLEDLATALRQVRPLTSEPTEGDPDE